MTPDEKSQHCQNPLTSSDTTRQTSFGQILLLLPFRWYVAVPLVLLFMIVGVISGIRFYYLSLLPPCTPPPEVEALVRRPPVPDDQNARIDYQRAEGLYGDIKWPEASMVRLAEANGWHWASPSVRRWMEQSRSAFEAYFEGAARPYLDFGDEISIGPLSGGSNSLFTRIFSGLEISRLSDNGEFSQSTEILKFQMRESLLAWNSQIRRSGVPRFGTVGENINEWIQDCRPPEGELQKLAEAARDTRIQLSSPSVRLAAAFIEMQHLDGYSASEFCKILDAANHKEASHFERFLFAEPELGQRINLHSMTLALPEMGKPRSERTADAFLPANGIHPINADGVSSSAINDAVKRSLYPVRLWSTKAQNVADEYDRSVALLRLIEAVIAVHRFQYRHGTFPATLQDLVPEFLEEVPVDPFSMTGEVLRYRLFDGGCAVYTVSWNSRDDGGWSVLFPYWYNSVDMDDDGFCIGSVSCESPSDF